MCPHSTSIIRTLTSTFFTRPRVRVCPATKLVSKAIRRSSTDTTGASVQANRSITAMTPEQLARKRANDRNAQRAIRARRKAQVSQLEAELEALKNKQHACCRELLLRNLELECELAMLKGSPLTSPTRTTRAGQVVDEGAIRAATSPDMASINGCDSCSDTPSPVAVAYPKCSQISRDTPLVGEIGTVYTAEGVVVANQAHQAHQALVSCAQVCPTISSPSMPDLWATGTHYDTAGGIMEGTLARLEVGNMVPVAGTLSSPTFPQ